MEEEKCWISGIHLVMRFSKDVGETTEKQRKMTLVVG